MNYLYRFGATYGCNTYGAGSYANDSCTTETSTGGAGNNNGGLANTGYDVIIPIALGLALVIAGAVLLVKRLLRKRK